MDGSTDRRLSHSATATSGAGDRNWLSRQSTAFAKRRSWDRFPFPAPEFAGDPRVGQEGLTCNEERAGSYPGAFKLWSGWRDSNPRPQPWQGRILAAELHPPGWDDWIRTSAWEIQNLLPYQLGDIPKHTSPWMGDQDSNLGMTDSESVALPTWLSPTNLQKIWLRVKDSNLRWVH
jgi:hypothetical protein